MSFGPHTVTILHRGDAGNRDAHNNPIIETLSTEQLAGCFLQQRNADEQLDGRETAVTTWLLLCPAPATRVSHIDHYRIDAAVAHTDPDPGETFATFRQFGHPDYLDHIDGTIHHLELILERVQL